MMNTSSVASPSSSAADGSVSGPLNMSVSGAEPQRRDDDHLQFLEVPGLTTRGRLPPKDDIRTGSWMSVNSTEDLTLLTDTENIGSFSERVSKHYPRFRGRAPQHVGLGGPIMLTAPHGVELYRGDPKLGEKLEVHRREVFTTDITLWLAKKVDKRVATILSHGGIGPRSDSVSSLLSETMEIEVNTPTDETAPATPIKTHPDIAFTIPRGKTDKEPRCASYCVWNCHVARAQAARTVDPNYIHTSEFDDSPWHQGLVQFKKHVEERYPPGTLPLHVDIHGKRNRKTDFNLDVGMRAMDEVFAKDTERGEEFVARMREIVEGRLADALDQCPVRLYDTLEPRVEMHPEFHGFRGLEGDRPHTMTTQAVMLGIPSMQIELPFAMRESLTLIGDVPSRRFAAAFADSIAGIFVDMQQPDVRGALREAYQAAPHPEMRAVWEECTALLADAHDRLPYECDSPTPTPTAGASGLGSPYRSTLTQPQPQPHNRTESGVSAQSVVTMTPPPSP